MKHFIILIFLLVISIFSGCGNKPVPTLTAEESEKYKPKDIKSAI